MDEYMGVVKLFAGNYVPQNYLMCNGALLPITQYTALFSLLGTTYGGDGRTTFALPDLRGTVALGSGTSKKTETVYNLGQNNGTERILLTVANLPAHNHTGSVVVSASNSSDGTPKSGASIGAPGSLSGRDFAPTLGFVSGTPNVVLSDTSVVTALTGSGQPVGNMQPFLALNYIICVQGIYPPRP